MSKRTRKASLAEWLMNVAVGYGLSVATTAIVLPWLFGIYIPLSSNLAIGLIFTRRIDRAKLRAAPVI